MQEGLDIYSDEPEFTALPFLKWAGGKRWLVKNHFDLLPTTYNTYYEPFLGSGAIFFALTPQKAVLSDANARLVETYTTIRDDWKKVKTILCRHQRNHSNVYYYEERSRVRRSLFERAAQFIYLNRTCWNGLYRVNLNGKFNVPRGTKDSVILGTDDFEVTSKTLRHKKIVHSDFEPIIDQAEEGDLIFADPPYTINHNLNGFIKYNERIFTWKDQERLCKSLVCAKERGVKIVLLNANHESIRKLYKNLGEINILSRHSIIAGKSAHRKPSSELSIICNV